MASTVNGTVPTQYGDIAFSRLGLPAFHVRVALMLGAAVAYVVGYWLLHPVLGDATGTLGALAVIPAGYLYGVRGGIAASLLTFPITSLLVIVFGETSWQEWLAVGGPIGSATVLVGAFVGWLRELSQRDMREIMERKRAEEALRESSRLASIGELAAGVAHEINNPLNTVIGFSQLLMEEDLPQPVREDVQRIYSEGQRAAKIVQNLLSFARKREPDKQYVDVTAIVHRTLELKAYSFKANNIMVSTQLPENLSHTMADEHQLVEVILNILTNAEQAMTEAHGWGRLTIRAARSADGLRISIRDDGPGISPEHMSNLFDPFFTTKEVGKGTGLGLSICYGIIHQHGGELWAESEPGQGATFNIDLPILAPEEASEPQPQEVEKPSELAKHILVVDDEPANLELVARVLATEGYAVDMASDGQEAWRMLQNKAYDRIFLDLKMPGMSGQQLYRLIEGADTELPGRVVFMTGDTFSPDSRDFLSNTGNPILKKPFSVDELRQHAIGLKEVTHAGG